MKIVNLTQSGNQDTLGNGINTIHNVGCLLTCFGMAANALTGTRFNVSQLNDYLRAEKCFVGGSLKREAACRVLGLRMRWREVDPKALRAALAAGEVVILGVDYKKGRSSGRSDADHFVLAHTVVDENTIVAANPGTGLDVTLTLDDSGRFAYKKPGQKPRVAVEATYLTA